MKKLMLMLLTVLSLCAIFGAGWAAGTNKTPATQTTVLSDGDTKSPDENPDGEFFEDNCPDGECPGKKCPKDRFPLPTPPILRKRIIKIN